MAGVDALISSVVDQLVMALIKEAEYVRCFEREFKSMNQRLSNVKTLLRNKDNTNQQIDEDALTTFRDLMYEADDILTDCINREYYQKNGNLSGLFFPNLFFRFRTAKKIRDINRRMEEAYGILDEHLKVQVGSSRRDDIDRFAQDCDPSNDKIAANEIIGLEGDVAKIKNWVLYSNQELQKICIVGMGGLGKTTIAKLIFNDVAVQKHFNRRIWVSDSQTLSVKETLRSILQKAGEILGEQSGTEMDQIIKLLQESTCLIILDNIWDKRLKLWEEFFNRVSKSEHKRCCIIITTRVKDVASAIAVDETQIHHPQVLNEKNSWSLFCKHALAQIKKEKAIETFEEEGKKILAECGGLPLAIKTIGGLLRSTPSLNEWKKICDKFSALNITEENAPVMNSLRLSYSALPPHLKQCLLSFSIYPEGVDIEAEKLIHLWVGEHLVQGSDSETAIELGFEYLSKLASRCLVEVVKRRDHDGRVYKCKMHDLVRDMTLMMAKDEKVCSFDGKGTPLAQGSRWLGFTSQMDAKSLKRSSKLRALFVMTSNHAPFDKNLGSLRSLRALDLSNNNLNNIALMNLLSWISSLKRLAYLNLSGAECLEQVPDSIRKLQNLQLLLLCGCINLNKLSISITCLKKLLVLDLGSCEKLPYLPCGIGRLSQLQELSGLRLVRHGNRRSCQLLEIKELKELRVLRIRLSKESKINEEERAVLSKLEKLKVLEIDFDTETWQKDSMLEMVNQLSAPPKLEELYLNSYHHETLPNWVSSKSLRNLVYLSIKNGCQLSNISKSSGFTWNIESLYLNNLPELRKDWNDLKEEMPLLRYAEVIDCPNLKNFSISNESI